MHLIAMGLTCGFYVTVDKSGAGQLEGSCVNKSIDTA